MTSDAKATPPNRIRLVMGTKGVRIWTADGPLPATFDGEQAHEYVPAPFVTPDAASVLRFLEQRAASYGAVRRSALTAIAIDQAIDLIHRLTFSAEQNPSPLPAVSEGGREAGWTYEYDSGAGWDTQVVLNTPPPLPTKRAPTQHYGSPDIRNVKPFYYAAAIRALPVHPIGGGSRGD